MLQGSASASRELQGYAHSERVTRKVPPLALVPLDQLQQLQQRKEKETQCEELNDKKVRRRRQRKVEDAVAEDGGGEREEREEQQQRLGERFLGMMALLARLRRMDLEEASSPTTKTERRQSARRSPLRSSRSVTAVTPVVAPPKEEIQKLSAYELLVQKKKAERSRGVVLSVSTAGSTSAIQLSPHRKPEPIVNEATAPLREHLTFEISMLLPQPMDTRQSVLESPIRRKKRRKRLRRKKRRLGATIVDGKRTWSTSHATWVPHASADYAKARSQEAVAAQASSKLVAKFAALKHAVRGGKGEEQQQRMYLYANEKEGREQRNKESRERKLRRSGEDSELVGEREEEAEEEEEEGEQEEQELSVEENNSGDDSGEDDKDEDDGEEEDEENEGADALPELLHPLSTASAPLLLPSKRVPLRQPPTVSVVRPVQTHQAAWISPELRRWLIGSGLFRTTSKSTLSSSSS